MTTVAATPLAPSHISGPVVSEIGERALIQRITARLTMPSWVVIGPGDDAAVLQPDRGALDVLTTDAQIEGVHFDRRFMPPEAIGHRALAVNLSDLAAMGARPRGVTLSLGLPDALEVAFVDRMLDGFLALADKHHVPVVGGNITRSPEPLIVDVTAIGSVRPRRVLTRAGARPGDGVYVTGTIGAAAVGLESLRGAPQERHPESEARFLWPEPRLRAGAVLGNTRAASACMDLSDGLADAVRQVAEASGVGISLEADALPIDADVQRWHTEHGHDAVDAALCGGEEYELLFTVRPRHQGRLRDARKRFHGLSVTRIGVVSADRRVTVVSGGRARDLPAGFEHFR